MTSVSRNRILSAQQDAGSSRNGELKLADVGNKFDHEAKRKFDDYSICLAGSRIACLRDDSLHRRNGRDNGDVSFGNWIEHKENCLLSLRTFLRKDIIDMYRWNDIHSISGLRCAT